jgi:S-DNA-T family DNA segregation ATPase FtsK/SpoIIIE
MINKALYRFFSYLWSFYEIRVVLCVAGTLFLGLSLISYSTADNTFFSYSTQATPLQNWCGFAGAHIAALLFFLVGAAGFLVVLAAGFYTATLIKRRSWKQEWERIIAFFVLPIIIACFLQAYRLDFVSVHVPGGFTGYHMMQGLYRIFDVAGALLFLYTVLCVCLIVIARSSFFKLLIFSFCCAKRFCTLRFKRLQTLKQNCLYLGQMVYAKAHAQWLAIPAKEQELYGYDPQELDQIFAREPVENEQLAQFFKEQSAGPANGSEAAHQKTIIIPAHMVVMEKQMPEMVEQPMKISAAEKPYALPNLSIFIGVEQEQNDSALIQELEKKALLLQEKLERFGVQGKVTAIKRGPVVTLYEYQPHIDTKISRIMTLEDDLALALQALSIRIIAPIPGKSLVGFEVANKNRKSVMLGSLLKTDAFIKTTATLPLVLGEDTIGVPMIGDLARMPHLLMAGSTGSGKSVALNTMLVSLLCKKSPDDLKLILIDPKRLEFAPFADIAHLLFPIITDPRQASPALRWVVEQMEERYEIMAQAGARNIADYRTMQYAKKEQQMPYIIVVIDELADLMMTAGREIEDLIIRITQMARAAGIHLIAATQRPSVDVITGLIKVNFPSRISFRVTSKIDSRTILDCAGADKLLGMGDMLFLDGSDTQLKRAHGAYVSDKEINQVVGHIKAERRPAYLDFKAVVQEALADQDLDIDQELLSKVVSFLHEIEEVSISLLQRRFRIGYNRSARIIDSLEAQGLVSPASGSRTRKVIR